MKLLVILQTSPFIHRDTNYYVLEDLQVVVRCQTIELQLYLLHSCPMA